jgi:methionyl-tRNA formyltransferase
MDKGLDTGNMLAKTSCQIESTDTAQTLHNKLARQGGAALLALLPLIKTNKLNPVVQNSELATYAEKLSKQEALIDWNQPANYLLRAIRAYNPWPVAFTTLNGKVLRVWGAAPSGETPKKAN